MSDVLNGAGNPAAEDTSFEKTMSDAYDKAMASDVTASVPAASLPEGAGLPSAEHDGEPPASSSASDRLRGPDGKFVEKPKTEVAPRAAPVETNPAAQTAEPQPSVSAPTSWAADKRALLDKADPALREYIALREKQQIEGVAKLKTEYEGKLGTLAPIAEALRPVEARLKVNNIHPAQYVSQLAAADEALRTDPHRAIVEVARMYGIDLGQLQTGGNQGQQAYVDPNQAALQQRLGQLEGYLQQQQRIQHEQETAQLNARIEAFKNDPKNAHFEAVKPYMAKLIQAGMATDLPDAYEQAVKLHPEVYAKVTQDQRAQEEATRKQEAERRATEAKRAASVNVATKGTIGASPSTPKSLEDTMRQIADRIYSAA